MREYRTDASQIPGFSKAKCLCGWEGPLRRWDDAANRLDDFYSHVCAPTTDHDRAPSK